MKKSVFVFLIFYTCLAGAGLSQQYKKFHREIMADISDGKIEEARRSLEELMDTSPDDPENLYMMSILYVLEDNTEAAMKYVQRALREGLPFGRYLAGPENVLNSFVESAPFKQLADKEVPYLVHGPMLGAVTDRSARFWVRTAEKIPVQIILSESEDMANPVNSEIRNTNLENDLTVVIELKELSPNTIYFYQVKLGDYTYPSFWSFKTFPLKGSPAQFSIGFGGGAGFTPKYEYMWKTIASWHFPAFLFLGDNVYIDHPERPAVQDFVYYRRQSVADYRFFTARTSIFAIWDDHDFGTNDSWGTAALDSPEWKIPVWEKFQNNWNNPYYGGGKDHPGVWFDFSIADIDLFMLDGRYYRTSPEAEKPDMLGEFQKEWLFEKLKASEATFKIIASPVPWSYGTKPGQQSTPAGTRPGAADTWEGFQEEREMIFSFIEENKIEGVILISADRHRSEAWKIIRPDGYDLYEFESSKLTNMHTHRVIDKSIFGYNDRCSFGVLEFETTKPDAEVIFRIVNIDNRIINEIKIRRSQLEFEFQD